MKVQYFAWQEIIKSSCLVKVEWEWEWEWGQGVQAPYKFLILVGEKNNKEKSLGYLPR